MWFDARHSGGRREAEGRHSGGRAVAGGRRVDSLWNGGGMMAGGKRVDSLWNDGRNEVLGLASGSALQRALFAPLQKVCAKWHLSILRIY